jgi:hypothetical protein
VPQAKLALAQVVSPGACGGGARFLAWPNARVWCDAGQVIALRVVITVTQHGTAHPLVAVTMDGMCFFFADSHGLSRHRPCFAFARTSMHVTHSVCSGVAINEPCVDALEVCTRVCIVSPPTASSISRGVWNRNGMRGAV